MSAREDLARLINNGVGVWRTPLEAADAILKAGYGKLADAWDEGQKSGTRHADRVIAADRLGRPELPGPPSPNPYRSES